LGNVVQIDEKRIHDHLGELVRGTVEETLNDSRHSASLILEEALISVQ
jgi:hypothetical protein